MAGMDHASANPSHVCNDACGRALPPNRAMHGRFFQMPTTRQDNSPLRFDRSTQKRRSQTAAAALFLASVLIPAVAHAVTYAFTPVAFAWIDPSSHTVVSAASAPIAFRSLAGCGTAVPVTDDTISDPISLGFNFQFAGIVVDSVRIMSNGRLQFLNQNPANGAVFDNTACNFGTPDQYPLPNASHSLHDEAVRRGHRPDQYRRGSRVCNPVQPRGSWCRPFRHPLVLRQFCDPRAARRTSSSS